MRPKAIITVRYNLHKSLWEGATKKIPRLPGVYASISPMQERDLPPSFYAEVILAARRLEEQEVTTTRRTTP